MHTHMLSMLLKHWKLWEVLQKMVSEFFSSIKCFTLVGEEPSRTFASGTAPAHRHSSLMAGLPLAGLCRTAEPVRSTRLQTFLNSAQLPPFVASWNGVLTRHYKLRRPAITRPKTRFADVRYIYKKYAAPAATLISYFSTRCPKKLDSRNIE